MKIIFLLIVLSLSSFAQTPFDDCEGSALEKLASGLAMPNCFNTRLSRRAELRDEAICGTCKVKFETVFTERVPSLSENDLKDEFLRISLEEYRKSMIENLVTALKIQALPGTGANYAKAIEQCSFKKTESFNQGCKNPENLKLLESSVLFKNLKQEMANEVAKFMSTKNDFSPTPTLLKRNPAQCFIPERQMLYILSSTIEEEFSPDMIKYFARIDVGKVSSVDEIFESEEFKKLHKDGVELLEGIKNHPFLASKFKSPADIQSFFSKVQYPFSENNLKEQIYAKAEGEKLEQKLASSCESSFKSLKEMVCSDEFSKGSLKLDPVTNFKKITAKEFESDGRELASDEELLSKNIELFKYCGNYSKPESLSLNVISGKIGEGIPSNYQAQTLSDYVSEKHTAEIGNLNGILCSKECTDRSLRCRLIKKYEDTNKPGTLDFKLANSSNPEGNRLLQSMIGDKQGIAPATLVILQEKGILPKEDGSINQQPLIPERSSSYFAEQSRRDTETASKTAVRPTSAPASGAGRAIASTSNVTTTVASQQSAGTSSPAEDLKELYRDSAESLSDIEDEIRRRLGEIPRGIPQNRNQARSIVRAVSREKRRTLSPEQENQMIDRMMNNEYSGSNTGPEFATSNPKPSISNTPTLAEQKRRNQMNEALSQMAGAVESAKNSQKPGESAEVSPDLAIVPLNIAADPKINLSQFFSEKFSQRDPETQMIQLLLKNNRNFVLQMRNMNFKVVFNGASFNLLLESGDRDVAARVRPQLEIFLGRLKSS